MQWSSRDIRNILHTDSNGLWEIKIWFIVITIYLIIFISISNCYFEFNNIKNTFIEIVLPNIFRIYHPKVISKTVSNRTIALYRTFMISSNRFFPPGRNWFNLYCQDFSSMSPWSNTLYNICLVCVTLFYLFYKPKIFVNFIIKAKIIFKVLFFLNSIAFWL